jgi:nicotinamidase/pyrazinamidase
MPNNRALIVVDVQNDFMPDGALPAAGGYEVVPVANRLMEVFDLVVATQDWHPPDHGSFGSNHDGHSPGDIIDLDGLDQILWPDHCVQHTEGAEFVDDLHTGHIDEVFRKGVDPSIDSYSGFFDNGHRRATGMGDYLREKGVDEICVVGVATDYCVKFTALDGRELDFQTWVCADGIAGVENEAGDIDAAIGEMRDAGVQFTDSGALIRRVSDA